MQAPAKAAQGQARGWESGGGRRARGSGAELPRPPDLDFVSLSSARSQGEEHARARRLPGPRALSLFAGPHLMHARPAPAQLRSELQGRRGCAHASPSGPAAVQPAPGPAWSAGPRCTHDWDGVGRLGPCPQAPSAPVPSCQLLWGWTAARRSPCLCGSRITKHTRLYALAGSLPRTWYLWLLLPPGRRQERRAPAAPARLSRPRERRPPPQHALPRGGSGSAVGMPRHSAPLGGLGEMLRRAAVAGSTLHSGGCTAGRANATHPLSLRFILDLFPPTDLNRPSATACRK